MSHEAKREIELEYAASMRDNMQLWAKQRNRQMREYLTQRGIEENDAESVVSASSFAVMNKIGDRKHCSLYGTGESCHPELKQLSCFLCACPHYDADHTQELQGKIFVGRCTEPRGTGKYHFSEHFPNVAVWDCSNCHLTHEEGYVKEWIRENTKKS